MTPLKNAKLLLGPRWMLLIILKAQLRSMMPWHRLCLIYVADVLQVHRMCQRSVQRTKARDKPLRTHLSLALQSFVWREEEHLTATQYELNTRQENLSHILGSFRKQGRNESIGWHSSLVPSHTCSCGLEMNIITSKQMERMGQNNRWNTIY